MFLAMPDSNTSDLVTVIAAGVRNYLQLGGRLPGPQHDIARLHSLFTEMSTTGKYRKVASTHYTTAIRRHLGRVFLSMFFPGRPPTTSVCSIFQAMPFPSHQQFSGLCTIDTAAHPVYTAPIPTNLGSFFPGCSGISCRRLHRSNRDNRCMFQWGCWSHVSTGIGGIAAYHAG